MALNYAEQWNNELLAISTQEALCSPFITTNVKWLSARVFHFTQMSTSGFGTHTRAGGWNKGTFAQTDNTYTVGFDRDIEFLVDKADVDETNETASVRNISAVFQKTQAVPEMCAYFFSKVAQTAQGQTGYHSSTAASADAFSAANVFATLKGFLASGKLRRYRAQGALVMYVTSAVMSALEESSAFTRAIDLTALTNDGVGLETRVTNIDGVPVVEVVDDERFYDKFDFTSGFAPVSHTSSVTGSHKINVLIASQLTTFCVPKISSIYFFAPGAHTEGDGYLYQNRQLYDVFTFPNGKDNQIDSVYVDTDTAEYGA